MAIIGCVGPTCGCLPKVFVCMCVYDSESNCVCGRPFDRAAPLVVQLGTFGIGPSVSVPRMWAR